MFISLKCLEPNYIFWQILFYMKGTVFEVILHKLSVVVYNCLCLSFKGQEQGTLHSSPPRVSRGPADVTALGGECDEAPPPPPAKPRLADSGPSPEPRPGPGRHNGPRSLYYHHTPSELSWVMTTKTWFNTSIPVKLFLRHWLRCTVPVHCTV